MRNLRFIIGRNLSAFLDNKNNIILSCLAVAGIMSLYFIFLRDFMFQMVEDRGIPAAQRGVISDRLMVGGLLSIVSAATCLSGMQQRILDKQTGSLHKELAFPISNTSLAFGYVLSSAAISTSYTVLTYILYEFYFYYRYGSELASETAVVILAFIKFASLINAAVLYILTDWIESKADFSSFANLYGTIIGFLAGAYLPYFFYGSWIRRLLFFLPATQMTSIFRQLVLTDLLSGLRPDLNVSQIEHFKRSFGIYLKDLTETDTVESQFQYQLLVVELLLLLACIFYLSRKRRKRTIA
ncbi:MAG: hypothetical protein Q4G58_06200 [bacterium]|nr:hypothetical protein [bacterium]